MPAGLNTEWLEHITVPDLECKDGVAIAVSLIRTAEGWFWADYGEEIKGDYGPFPLMAEAIHDAETR